MDWKVVAWGRAVKAREARAGRHGIPPLWLFTDPVCMPDLHATIAALPRHLCGVVFRHDGVPGRAALALGTARQCRRLRIPLSVSGNWRLAAQCRAGQHLRDGRGLGWPQRRLIPSGTFTTSSVHNRASRIRAMRSRADLIFISPAFPTRSHPGAHGLGPVRWAALARPSAAKVRTLALGGLTGREPGRLPRHCAGGGAIGALSSIVA